MNACLERFHSNEYFLVVCYRYFLRYKDAMCMLHVRGIYVLFSVKMLEGYLNRNKQMVDFLQIIAYYYISIPVVIQFYHFNQYIRFVVLNSIFYCFCKGC